MLFIFFIYATSSYSLLLFTTYPIMTEYHSDFVSPIRTHVDIKTLALRDIPLSTIINTTKRILQEIESLKSDYVRTTLKSESSSPQETAAFHLEYGTISKLKTLYIYNKSNKR
jgi:hypothetical protein